MSARFEKIFSQGVLGLSDNVSVIKSSKGDFKVDFKVTIYFCIESNPNPKDKKHSSAQLVIRLTGAGVTDRLLHYSNPLGPGLQRPDIQGLGITGKKH